MRLPLASIFGILALAGCGLSAVGSATGDAGASEDPSSSSSSSGSSGGDSSTSPADGGSSDPWPEASPPDSCTCAITAPPGWSLVAFAEDRANACPAGFDTRDLVADVSAGSSACSCGACSVTSAASCLSGTFSTMNNGGTTQASCNNTGVSHSTNNGACAQQSGTVASYSKSIPPAATGGACGAAGVKNEGAVTTTLVRACAPLGASCACDPALGPSRKTCLRADGDLACPAQAPNKRVVGPSFALTCASCTCSATSTCTAGGATFYTDGQCNNMLSTSPIGACSATGATSGTSYGSYKWQATTTTTCGAPQPTAPASVSLNGASTICCP